MTNATRLQCQGIVNGMLRRLLNTKKTLNAHFKVTTILNGIVMDQNVPRPSQSSSRNRERSISGERCYN